MCNVLESAGLRCWIAPRDVGPGATWAEAVLPGIQAGRVLVLVFSATANASPQVVREVDAAVKAQKAILSFRVDPIVPSREIGPLLSQARWLDAFTPPLAQHLHRLGRTVQKLLEPQPPPDPAPPAALEEPLGAKGPGGGRRWRLAAAVVLLVGAVGAWAILSRPGQSGRGPEGGSLGRADAPAVSRTAAATRAPLALLPPVPAWARVTPAQIAESQRLQVPVAFVDDTTRLRFVLVPGGTFTMGSPESEAGRYHDEGPQHQVTVFPFHLALTETTNTQYRWFRAEHVSGTGLDADDQPVVQVSHTEATAFATWLAGSGGLRGARLPTEAEWEYACRAGTTTPFSFGDTLSTDQANYDGSRGYGKGGPGEYRGTTTPVGSLASNPWGLHDMHGNAWEWCSDWMGAYSERARHDPRGPTSGASRVLRGGSWLADPWNVRSAFRAGLAPGARYDRIGFRVALSVTAR